MAATTEVGIEPQGRPGIGERRSHPRRKMIVPVAVRAAESGMQIAGELTDVSRGGCFVRTQTPLPMGTVAELKIASGEKAFQALAKVVSIRSKTGMGLEFVRVDAESFHTLSFWLDKSIQNLRLAGNHQCAPKLPLQVPVRISGYDEQGARFSQDCYTSEIDRQGASVLLPVPAREGQRVVLTHRQTRVTVECLVARCQRNEFNQFIVELAFVAQAPQFWLVSFPQSRRPAAQVQAMPASNTVSYGETHELRLTA